MRYLDMVFAIEGHKRRQKKPIIAFSLENLTLAIASLLQQALAMTPSGLPQPVASPGKSS